MMSLDGFEIFMICFMAALIGLLIFTKLFPPDPETEFTDQCRAQGMGFKEIQAAKAIRVSFVQVRRMASDLCIEKGGDLKDHHLDELIQRQVIGLQACYGDEAAKSFLAWIKSCPDSEILYRDARDARMKYWASLPKVEYEVDPQLRQDWKDAFKIVRE